MIIRAHLRSREVKEGITEVRVASTDEIEGRTASMRGGAEHRLQTLWLRRQLASLFDNGHIELRMRIIG